MVKVFGPVYVTPAQAQAADHFRSGTLRHDDDDGEHRGYGRHGEQEAEFEFKAPVKGKGVMIIKNGGSVGEGARVSSAAVELNDAEVAHEFDFNRNVEELRYDVDLEEDNELEVKVRSCKGCELEITVLGEGLEFPRRVPSRLPTR